MDLAIQDVWVPDFRAGRIVHCHVGIENGVITAVSDSPLQADTVVEGEDGLLTPGLMDAHVHIESALISGLMCFCGRARRNKLKMMPTAS